MTTFGPGGPGFLLRLALIPVSGGSPARFTGYPSSSSVRAVPRSRMFLAALSSASNRGERPLCSRQAFADRGAHALVVEKDRLALRRSMPTAGSRSLGPCLLLRRRRRQPSSRRLILHSIGRYSTACASPRQEDRALKTLPNTFRRSIRRFASYIGRSPEKS